MIQLLLVEFQKHTYHLPTSVKPGFHIIATIAVIAEKKKSSAIEAIIWKPLSSDGWKVVSI